MVKAINIVVITTPLALLSCFFFIKTKKTNKLGIAAIDNILPYNPPSSIICKVSLNPNLEKYSMYKKHPAAGANNEIRMPIDMSFFTVPKNLIFESYDEQSNQTELEQ